MEEDSFGQFLHKIRMRVKGSDLARQAGISYVYLLDIERGARSVPSAKVLLALANNLPFNEGERRRYVDLAAKEDGTGAGAARVSLHVPTRGAGI